MHGFNEQDNRFYFHYYYDYLLLLLLLLPSSSLLLARGTSGNEFDYGGTAYEHEIKGKCFV